MSGYDVEHGIKNDRAEQPRRRRPDLSTFFTNLDLVDTTGSRQPHNANSVPLPQDIENAFRSLADAFEVMQGGAFSDSGSSELLAQLVSSLRESAEHPPTEVQGVSDEFIEQLERVPKKLLKPDQSCPICANPFLEDPHPLVVRLPCHKDHIFDLECIQPWIKLNPTCPLDRQALIKKRAPPPPKDEDEEDFDDMYA